MNSGEDPKQKSKKIKKQTKQQSPYIWPIKVLVLSFALTIFFGISSELLLSGAGIAISILIIVIFVAIAIVSDMIGVAITACNVQPFRAMASKKVRGAKEAIKLLNKADRVSSICCDVIGDICGILSGAAGASIIVKIVSESSSTALSIIISSLVSAIIASLTIFGKALGKKYSMQNCNSIILAVGKFFSLFTPQGNKKNKNQKQQTQEIDNQEEDSSIADLNEKRD